MLKTSADTAVSLPGGTVTAMFTDVVDSTALKGNMRGDTTVRRDRAYVETIKTPHDKRVLGMVRESGGRKVKSTGDGFLFTFGDADEAVLCALSIQDTFAAQPIETPLGPLRLRIGVHTGGAPPATDDYTGTTFDKAARIQARAEPGEVLVSDETRVIARDLRGVRFDELESADLKGLGPCTVYRVSRAIVETGRPAADAPSLSELDNPYDFATTADQRTFKGRSNEVDELIDSIETGTHTAIFGLQRMGKTSLIEQGVRVKLLANANLKDAILFATIDMQRLGGAQVTYRDFMHAIVTAVQKELAAVGLSRDVPELRTLTDQLFAPGHYYRGNQTEFFASLATLLNSLATSSKRRLVLFIDEFSEIRKVIERNKTALQRNPSRSSRLLAHDMYIDVPFIHHLSSLLKDDALKRRITFVVLVRPFVAEYDEREGLQLLKLMKPITLGRLDETAARELITEPLKSHISYEEGAVEYLARLTAGHPYLLQFILKLIVDKIKRNGRPTIMIRDIKWVEDRMISDGPAFDPQFAVLISDYSVDEVTHPKEAQLGKGMLALVSKFGQHADGWVPASVIFREFARYKIPEEKTTSLLSQLTRTCILDERDDEDQLHYRLSIPLVQARFVRQNLYRKYFRND